MEKVQYNNLLAVWWLYYWQTHRQHDNLGIISYKYCRLHDPVALIFNPQRIATSISKPLVYSSSNGIANRPSHNTLTPHCVSQTADQRGPDQHVEASAGQSSFKTVAL
jgi:hypothetical protein